MTEYLSSALPILAILISGTTAYLTLFRRGSLNMTRPTVIFFGPDGGSKKSIRPVKQKIFLRALLYCTGKRGRIIEGMFAKISRGESQQTFNIWVYGDKELLRGSGLFVGENGIACNHHFLLPDDGTDFRFIRGDYKLKIFANVIGDKNATLLGTIDLHISDGLENQLSEPDTGLYFDWGPDSKKYHPYVEKRNSNPPKELSELLGILKEK
jgi:hypothetical protein